MKTPDYDAWDMVQSFTIVEAAFLWLDMEPEAHHLNPRVTPHVTIFDRVRALAREIGDVLHVDDPSDYGARNGLIYGYDGTEHPHWNRTKMARNELVSLANQRGKRPPFLFPDERPTTADVKPLSTMEGSEPFTQQPVAPAPALDPEPGEPEPAGNGVTVILPYKTKALEALIQVMRDTWGSYDPRSPPQQNSIGHAIDAAIGWKTQKDGSPSRDARAVARIIQPDEVQDGRRGTRNWVPK